MSRRARPRRGLAALAGAVAGVGALTAYLATTATSERAQRRWLRTNHAGRPVTLLEGPAYAVGAAVGAAAAGPAGMVATLGAGAFGALDDLAGDSGSKGLKGHLGALRQGRVTTGAAKILGISAAALTAVALTDRRDGGGCGCRGIDGPRSAALDLLLGAGVVAGAANLANLLDLRPGRALKVVVLTGGPLAAAGRVEAGAAVGAALALLGPDLAGESMLGDTGANAAGALVGLAAARQLSLRGRLLCLGVLTALTVASERVSFTKVIEATPGLRELDALGRPR